MPLAWGGGAFPQTVLFATGYGMGAGANRRDAPVIDKPYSEERLASGLMRAMAVPKAAGPAA
jgi:hypothetical protein